MEPTVQKHICGSCNDEFLTEAEYIAHVCPTTNVTPADPAHQGPAFVEVQRAALERGLENLQAHGAAPEQIAVQQEAIHQLDAPAEQQQPAAVEQPVEYQAQPPVEPQPEQPLHFQ